MSTRYIVLLYILGFSWLTVSGQAFQSGQSVNPQERLLSVNGFMRGAFYYDLNNYANEPYFSSGFSDFGLMVETIEGGKFRGYADLRFRYGSEFNRSVSYFTVREAYADYSLKFLTFSAGKKIIKWGRADFTNPTSRLNPVDMTARSTDREDMDMGNLLAEVILTPLKSVKLEAVLIPYYKSSVLLIDPFPLPENVTINQDKQLVTDKKMVSYGLKSDFYLRGVDFSLSWFDGYDPTPGIQLTMFDLDMSGTVPATTTILTMTPYKTRAAGIDFETVIGLAGFRGEAAWSKPYLSSDTYEYVPLQEIKWALGLDFSAGNLRFTGEYSGKTIPGFKTTDAAPIFGTEPDLELLAQLMMIPGFDLNEYVRTQVEAFNRQYNYQLEQWYHSVGARFEADISYGRINPSLFALYNITSGDLIIIPEIRFKPYDGVTISLGADIYTGREGSLFDLIDEFMTSAYAGIKIEF